MRCCARATLTDFSRLTCCSSGEVIVQRESSRRESCSRSLFRRNRAIVIQRPDLRDEAPTRTKQQWDFRSDSWWLIRATISIAWLFLNSRRCPQSEDTHRYTLFAGQRVRVAEAVVELIERKPARVARMTFDILTFDRQGCFATEAFDRHQFRIQPLRRCHIGIKRVDRRGSTARRGRQLLEEVVGRPQGRCCVPCATPCWAT